MAVYFANTEITGIKDLFPLTAKDITGLYFADTELFTVWNEYDGTLPATYSANGDYLADYRVYGSAGGVGDRTENLLNQNEAENGNGYRPNVVITSNGALQSASFFVTEYIKINQNTEYSYFQSLFDSSIALIQFFDLSKNLLSSIMQVSSRVATEYAPNLCTTFTSPQNAEYVRFNVQKSAQQNILVEGSTAPAEYIPYGHEVNMSISGGNLFKPKPEILISENWVPYGSYFIYYKLDNRETNALKSFAQIAATAFLKAGGEYYSKLVLAVSPEMVLSPASNYRIILNDGTVTPHLYDMRAWADIYLCIGYSDGMTASRKQLLIDKLFENFDIDLCVGAIPIAHQPYPTVAPIYIGSDPLGEDEYVSFKEQKIYRMSGGVLTPTDPPVPLPALPTVDGTNIVDYAGQSAAVPSRFYAKYRKEGFK